jgi:alpha-beta hydrolase superfamily lysophospholipase
MNDRELLLNAIFFPRPSYRAKDRMDHLIKVGNDIHVGARFFLKDKNYPTILFFHGNAELSHEYDDIASCYHEHQLNFIVADYRGYGLSSGTPTKDNLHSDSNKIFLYVKSFLDEHEYNQKKIIMGRSLGSASASEIVSNYKSDIDGCVIESGFGTEIPLMRILDLEPDDVGYDPKYGFENLRKLTHYKGPLLIIHSEMDDIIHVNEAMLIHRESLSQNKEIWIVKNANHNNILMHAQKEYFKKIKMFIDSI